MVSTISQPGTDSATGTERTGTPTPRRGTPYALLRAGFPYYATLGMRRVTTYCMDIAVGDEGRLFVLCRDDGQGGTIRRINWDDEDLGTIGGGGRGDGQFLWPVQLLRDRQENLFVSDEGLHRITVMSPGRDVPGQVGRARPGPGPARPALRHRLRRRREPVSSPTR